jgi:hypothetical protein
LIFFAAWLGNNFNFLGTRALAAFTCHIFDSVSLVYDSMFQLGFMDEDILSIIL